MDDHGYVPGGGIGFYNFRDILTVHAGESEVHQDNIRVRGRHSFERRQSRARLEDFIAAEFDESREHLPQTVMVLDDQDFLSVRGHAAAKRITDASGIVLVQPLGAAAKNQLLVNARN
jgi:hypothetical protein